MTLQSQYFQKSGATPSLSQFAAQVDQTLVAAGWERVWANANAIGTGTANNPLFNTVAYSGNASFGIVHYRMPASGSLPRWIWVFDFSYGGGGTIMRLSVATATAADGAGGTTGLSAFRVNNGGAFSGADCGIVADDHEALVAWAAGARTLIGRGRRLDNVRLGDAVTLVGGGTTGVTSTRRNWTSGEAATVQALFELAPTSNTAATPPTSNASADTNDAYPIGPYGNSGGRAGLPRLWQEMCATDAPAAVTQTLLVDGVNAQYIALDASGVLGASTRTLMARS